MASDVARIREIGTRCDALGLRVVVAHPADGTFEAIARPKDSSFSMIPVSGLGATIVEAYESLARKLDERGL